MARMPPDQMRRYGSAETAARLAGERSKQREARDRPAFEAVCGPFCGPEYSGAIYELVSGGFVFTEAPTLGPADLLLRNQKAYAKLEGMDRVRFRPAFGTCDPTKAPAPREPHRLVAYWHTHPGSCSYSESDREFVRRTGLPLYLTRSRQLGRGPITELLRPDMLEGGNHR